MRLPDPATCRALLAQYQVPEHIIEHSRQVAGLSYYLGASLNACGYDFSLSLLLAAGLLHDIAKMRSIEEGGNHAELGAEWLEDEGYPEIAVIVRQHVHLQTDLEAPINARELVFYADKRVRHVEMVSITERMSDLVDRYGKDDYSRQRLDRVAELTRAVEIKIFTPLGYTPEELPWLCRPKNILTSWFEDNI